MSVTISSTQAEKIQGVPVDQVYVTAFLLTRNPDQTTKFSLEIRFNMAIKADTGTFILMRKERVVKLVDVESYAIAQAMLGNMDTALADPALQRAIAQIVASQCPDLSTATFVS